MASVITRRRAPTRSITLPITSPIASMLHRPLLLGKP
jgi:hypothetical protein